VLPLDSAKVARDTQRAATEVRGTEAALALWRRAYAEYVEPNYSLELARGNEAGMSTSFREQVVDTPAAARLQALLSSLRGGSIGIAGPRGAGKTTLIHGWCGRAGRTLGARKVLPVLTSAPVDYQTRDFLLHLFATLCQAVVVHVAGSAGGPLGPSHPASGVNAASVRQPPAADDAGQREWLAHLWLAGGASALLSLLLVLLAVGLGIDVAGHKRAAAAAAAAASAPASSPVSAGASSPTAASAPASAATLTSTPTTASTTASTTAPTTPSDSQPSLNDVLAILAITPGSLLSAGLLLGAAGGALLLLVRLRVLALRRQGVLPAPVAAEEAGKSRTLDPASALVRVFKRWYQHLQALRAPEAASAQDPLVREAWHWLREIKFQQTWTTGSSGALKTPLGVEAGISQARQMAQAQLTLPEIADAFVAFVTRIAQTGAWTVMIGIDELDKIESDEKAQRFLNDIKVVFGARDVFFLVSVSENAMSQFERRGLPFRDAFDSAFDEVVAVRHLDFRSAALMLGERKIGLPVPFQALCWVMSGGLARELVRSVRKLTQALPADGSAAPLAVVLETLLRQELAGKARAVVHAAEQMPPTPASVELLRRVDELTVLEQLDAAALVHAHRELLALAAAPGHLAQKVPTKPPPPRAGWPLSWLPMCCFWSACVAFLSPPSSRRRGWTMHCKSMVCTKTGSACCPVACA
jgi:hypothetical protein